jgi:hypothetical protein
VDSERSLAQASGAIRIALEGLPQPEMVFCRFVPGGASRLE